MVVCARRISGGSCASLRMRRSAKRELKRIYWSEYACTKDNHHVMIGKENYIVSGDGFLMPVRKGQAPPDLKYFQNAQQ